MKRLGWICLLLGLLQTRSLLAQELRATITGRVTDSSGAAVPNVPVEVTSTETNQLTRVVTDGQGHYTAPFLRPGSYVVIVEAQGFKKFVRAGLELVINQTATVDVALEVGALSDSVTVTAEAPLIETSKADRGNVIDSARINELPLNGRNPFMLSALVAGVQFNGEAIYTRPFDNGAIANWSINGGRSANNDFLLDGAPNNSQAGENNIALVPPVDSVQEFKIQTSSFDAQYGHTGGGIVNVSTKSGTNTFHGTGYEFARRKAWDANSFQNNAAGAPRDAHYLDQFGGEVEGPIYLPKLYDGRNKSFFMFNYEYYREGTPRPSTYSVPAPEMLNGDFSKLVTGDGTPITIYDPQTGRDVNGVWTRDPFPNNVIPQGRLNPIAQKILGYFPKPNTTTPGENYTSLNYFFTGDPSVDKDRFYNMVIKLDQQIGTNHHLFFREASNDRTEMVTYNGIIGVGENGSAPEKRVNDAYVLDWVGTLNARTLANVRVSFSRFIAEDRGDHNQGFDMTTLGFPKSLVSQLPGGAYFGNYGFTDYTDTGLGQYPSGDITNSAALQPSVIQTWSGHTLKAGADMRWVQFISRNYGNPLQLNADRGWTQQDYAQGDDLSGNSIASFLLGTPSSGGADNIALTTFLYKYYAPWVQDDWRISKRLTLNLGLRWDFNVPANERYNRLNRGFDPNVTNPVDQMIDRTQFPGVPTLRGSLLFAGVNRQPRTAADTYKGAIQPRAGFAYQISSKLVMRGGWGRYYLNPSNNYLQSNGFSITTPLVTSLNDGRSPIPNLINNPFPGGLLSPPGASQGALSFLGQDFSIVNSGFKLPHVDQFSFGFQYELPHQSMLEATYSGNRGSNLESTNPAFNTYDLAFRQKCDLMQGGDPLYCDEQLPNPFFGLAPFAGTSLGSSPTISRSGLAAAYPEFGTLTKTNRNDGKSWYNSMQLTYEMRAKGGLNIITAYTLSKMVDRSGFNDSLQRTFNQGLYNLDRPHVLSVAAVWALPVGPGKRWLNASNGFVKRVVGGWEVNSILTYQSGRPWRLPSNVIYVKEAKNPNIDWSANRVHGVSPCVAQWNDDGSITMESFSKAAGCTDYNFLITPRYAPRFTPASDGRLRNEAQRNIDLSLNKVTRITEKTSIQFRAEAFNLTNSYSVYGANFGNNPRRSSFGSVSPAAVGFEQASPPRFIQLGVKFLW